MRKKSTREFKEFWKTRFNAAKKAFISAKNEGANLPGKFEDSKSYKKINQSFGRAKNYRKNAKKINRRRRELYKVKKIAFKLGVDNIDNVTVFNAFTGEGRQFFNNLMKYDFSKFVGIVQIFEDDEGEVYYELPEYKDERERIFGTLIGFRLEVNRIFKRLYQMFGSEFMFKWSVDRSRKYDKRLKLLTIRYEFTQD